MIFRSVKVQYKIDHYKQGIAAKQGCVDQVNPLSLLSYVHGRIVEYDHNVTRTHQTRLTDALVYIKHHGRDSKRCQGSADEALIAGDANMEASIHKEYIHVCTNESRLESTYEDVTRLIVETCCAEPVQYRCSRVSSGKHSEPESK